MNKTTLSIVIPSYNTKRLLVNCVSKIIDTGLAELSEIMVIDNASDDGSAAHIAQTFPQVQVVSNATNKRFAGACNQGAALAQGKYLLFLNSDTLPGKGQIEALINFLEKSADKIACVGPRVIYPDGKLQTEGHPLPGLHSTIASLLGIALWPVPVRLKKRLLPAGYHRFLSGQPREVGWISGSCMLMKASAWEEIGGFDEKLYFYREDIEWSYRAKKRGYQTWVYPPSKIVHLGNRSTSNNWRHKRNLNLLKGEKHYYRATQGLIHHFLNNTLILLTYPVLHLLAKAMSKTHYATIAQRQTQAAWVALRVIGSRAI